MPSESRKKERTHERWRERAGGNEKRAREKSGEWIRAEDAEKVKEAPQEEVEMKIYLPICLFIFS